MELFPQLLSKYGVTPNLATIDTTFAEIYALAFKLDAEIKSASKSTETETPVSAYDSQAKDDETANNEATETIVSFLADIADLCERNPNVAFHLAEQVKSVSQFITSEVQYARRCADRSLPADKRSDAMDVKRQDRKELTVFLRNFWNTFTPLQTNVPKGVEVKDGKLVLPNLQGRQNGESGNVPTGKYAKLYNLEWSVNDEVFPVGTDPFLVVRSVWTGSDRIGKKLSDLYDPFDAAKGKSLAPGDKVTFELNGQTVSARMVAADSDE